MTDLDVERRLREAFDAKAEQLLPSRATPPPLDLDRPNRTVSPLRRHRRVWIGTGLVAAAAAVVVGTLVAVGGDALTSAPPPVAPAEQTTVPAPPGTGTPSVQATPPATSSTVAATSAAPPPTRTVSLDGVRVTVPAAWQPAPARPDTPYRCLTVGGVAQQIGRDGVTGNCELRWAVGTALGVPDPDVLYVFGNAPATCHDTTTTADEVTVDGRTAEHRVFTGTCFPGTLEQWTVMTVPVVVMARDVTDATAGDTAATTAAVAGAQIPAQTSPLRVHDAGYARGVTTSTLTLDRITFVGGGRTRDVNPATYDYPVSSATTITGPAGPITLAQLAAMVAADDYSAAGISGAAYVAVDTDGTTVTDVLVHPVS